MIRPVSCAGVARTLLKERVYPVTRPAFHRRAAASWSQTVSAPPSYYGNANVRTVSVAITVTYCLPLTW